MRPGGTLALAKLQIKDHTGSIDLAVLDVSMSYSGTIVNVNNVNNEKPEVNISFSKDAEILEPAVALESIELVLSKVLPNDQMKTFCRSRGVNDGHGLKCNPPVFSAPALSILVWNLPASQPLLLSEQTGPIDIDLVLHLQFDQMKALVDKEQTINNAIRSLCNSIEMSDAKIICQGKEFPCHKLILSLRSSVFKRMFLSNLRLSEAEDDSTLKIDDVSAETMEVFLKFLYTDELNPENVNSDLLICADKYDVKRLVNVCVKHFESIIDTNNVMEIAFTAYLIEHEQLLKKASKFIINNAGEIKKPDKWDQITNTHPQITKKVMDLVVFKTQSLTIK